MFSKLKKKAKTASLSLRGKDGYGSGDRGRGEGEAGAGLARHPNKAGSDISSGEEENIASFRVKPDPLATPKRKRTTASSTHSSEAESTSTWPSRRVLAAPDGHLTQGRFERAKSPPMLNTDPGRSRMDKRYTPTHTSHSVMEKSPKQKRHRSRSPAHRKFVYDDEDEEEELQLRMANTHHGKHHKKHVYESHSVPGTPKSRKPRKAPMPPKRTSSLITAESLDSTTTATLSDVMFSSEWTSSSNASDVERTYSGCSVNSGQPIDARQGDIPTGALSDDYVTMQSLMEEELDYSCHGDIQETSFPFVSYHGNTMDNWIPTGIFHNADQQGQGKNLTKKGDEHDVEPGKLLKRPLKGPNEGHHGSRLVEGDILDGRGHIGRGHMPSSRMRSSMRGRNSRARTRFPGEASPVNVRRAAMSRELEDYRSVSPSTSRMHRHTPQPVYISVVKVDYNAHLCDLYNGQQFNSQQFNGQQYGPSMSQNRHYEPATSSLDVSQSNILHTNSITSSQVSMQTDSKTVPCEVNNSQNKAETDKKQVDGKDTVEGMTVIEEDVKPGFSPSDEDQTFPMICDFSFRATTGQSNAMYSDIKGNPGMPGPRPRSEWVDASRVLGINVNNQSTAQAPLIQIEPQRQPEPQMRSLDRAPPLGRRILGVIDSAKTDGKDDDVPGQTVLPEICQGLTDLKLVVTEADHEVGRDDTHPKQVYDNPSVIHVAQHSADGTSSTSGSEAAPVPPPRNKRKKSKLKSGDGEDSISQDSSAHGSSDDLLKFKLELLPDIARDLPPTANTRTDTMCTPTSTSTRPASGNPGRAPNNPTDRRLQDEYPRHLSYPAQPTDDDYQGIAIDDDEGAVGGVDNPDAAAALYQWQLKPVENWDSDDVIEWCQAKGLDDIAKMIQGKFPIFFISHILCIMFFWHDVGKYT